MGIKMKASSANARYPIARLDTFQDVKSFATGAPWGSANEKDEKSPYHQAER
jgi:hypothetical protein